MDLDDDPVVGPGKGNLTVGILAEDQDGVHVGLPCRVLHGGAGAAKALVAHGLSCLDEADPLVGTDLAFDHSAVGGVLLHRHESGESLHVVAHVGVDDSDVSGPDGSGVVVGGRADLFGDPGSVGQLQRADRNVEVGCGDLCNHAAPSGNIVGVYGVGTGEEVVPHENVMGVSLLLSKLFGCLGQERVDCGHEHTVGHGDPVTVLLDLCGDLRVVELVADGGDPFSQRSERGSEGSPPLEADNLSLVPGQGAFLSPFPERDQGNGLPKRDPVVEVPDLVGEVISGLATDCEELNVEKFVHGCHHLSFSGVLWFLCDWIKIMVVPMEG